jgi:outer membrane protein TolC
MKTQIIVGGLLILFAGPVAAQQEIPALTLEEAVQVARGRNPAFRRIQLGIRDAEARVLSAYGTFLPDLRASMGWGGTRRTTTIGEDDFGGTIVQNQSRTFTSSNASQSLSTSLTLFDGFRNLNGVRAARKGVEAAEAGVAVQELALVADVSRAFYQAILAGKQIDVEEQLLESAQEDLDRQERLFSIASSDQVQVLTAELRVQLQEQALERAVNEAKKARLAVLQRLGTLGEVTDFEPIGDLPAVFDPTIYSVEELVAMAAAGHPSIVQSDAQVSQQERALAQARAERLPSISASGSFSRGAGTDGYSSFFEFNPTASRSFNFNLSVSLPIFQRFSLSQSASTARVAVDQAEEDLWAARLLVEQQVRSAFIDLQNAHTAFQIQTRSTDLNRQRLQLAQEQYRLGTGAVTFIDLQRYIDEVATAERDLVNRQLDFTNALVALDQQVGQPIPRPGQ